MDYSKKWNFFSFINFRPQDFRLFLEICFVQFGIYFFRVLKSQVVIVQIIFLHLICLPIYVLIWQKNLII
jgi:hypothetical protein